MYLLDYDILIVEFSMWSCYDGSSYLGRFHTFSNYYFGRTIKRVSRSGFYGVVGVAEGGFEFFLISMDGVPTKQESVYDFVVDYSIYKL